MKAELGFARCALACCVCGENESCPGCRADGCKDKDACKNRRCSLERGLAGCWQCADFPSCAGNILDKPRVRAFAAYIRKYGEAHLLECLARNEAAGVCYHYPGQIVGDYDQCEDEAAVWRMIERGRTE